jgi:hypothetical protein
MLSKPKKPTQHELRQIMHDRQKRKDAGLPSLEEVQHIKELEEIENLRKLKRLAKKVPRTKEEKRLAKLEAEKEKLKKAVVVQLRKTPLVQFACEKTGVGRSTYYKWRAEDNIFARVADRAIESSRFLMNDLAESKLLNQIQGDILPAITFWLRHNHPKYASEHRTIHEFHVATVNTTVEEDSVYTEEIAKYIAKDVAPKITAEEIRQVKERELIKAELEQDGEDRVKFFEED